MLLLFWNNELVSYRLQMQVFHLCWLNRGRLCPRVNVFFFVCLEEKKRGGTPKMCFYMFPRSGKSKEISFRNTDKEVTTKWQNKTYCNSFWGKAILSEIQPCNECLKTQYVRQACNLWRMKAKGSKLSGGGQIYLVVILWGQLVYPQRLFSCYALNWAYRQYNSAITEV